MAIVVTGGLAWLDIANSPVNEWHTWSGAWGPIWPGVIVRATIVYHIMVTPGPACRGVGRVGLFN